MDFEVLGPVRAFSADRPVDLGPPRQRAVLAALLIDAGRPVSLDVLTEKVWAGDPPTDPRSTLYVYLSRLRSALKEADGCGPHRVAGGYRLGVAPDRVDLHRFRRLARANRAADLRAAVTLWRGTPLADLTGPWAERTRSAWHREHVDALTRWADVELARGQAGVLLGPLRRAVADHPLAEPLAGALLRALAATGRNAEALEYYAVTRAHLADELGVEPGPALRRLHEALLRGEPTVATPSRAVPAPAQLPADVPGFTGRGVELAAVDSATAGGVPIVVSGTGGVGKTALLAHWGHRVASRFPDGQLYVNLRGFDQRPAAQPVEVVAGFLTALGVPAGRLPSGLDARTALFRSRVAGRRLLVLLDNARDADQVRPLLPGSPDCQVVITSRDRLAPLIAVVGARPVPLDPLDDRAARRLLTHRLGPDRVVTEPAGVEALLALCAGLPLALTIVAARAAVRPRLPLAAIAAEVAAGPLQALTVGDASTDLRTVFSWSYRALSEPAARLFRLFGRRPGLSTVSAAGLAGLPVAEVRPLIGELIGAGLLTEPAPGRYDQHVLVRAYAAELAAERDPVDQVPLPVGQ